MAASNEQLVRDIFVACQELSTRTGLSISPDGHLVGSLGEVYAAQHLNLTLQKASNKGFDATDTAGRKVEIKTTTGRRISLSARGTAAERLVVVQLDRVTGAPVIAYDGDAQIAWDRAGAPQKNGQRSLSLTTLTG